MTENLRKQIRKGQQTYAKKTALLLRLIGAEIAKDLNTPRNHTSEKP